MNENNSIDEKNNRIIIKTDEIVNGDDVSIKIKDNHKKLNGIKSSEEKETKKKKVMEKNKILNFIYEDSKKVGKNLLAWILSPIKVKEFFENFWEKKPLYISRNNNEYYNELCSMNAFEKALSEKDMYFTKNIDVTSYIDGQRFTENLDGKATVSNIWDFFNEGKSIRLLNPQTFIPNVWLLNTNLQVCQYNN